MKLINRPLLTMVSVAALLVGCDTLSLKKSDQAKTPAEQGTQAPLNQQAPSQAIAPEEHKYDTVWDHIRAGYGLPQTSNSTIDAQIHFYTSKKKYFYGVMQQSEPYLYYVAKEMQANDMPMELALLPFIESAYNPTASSPGNQNVGMWQFGTATARNLGLKQNSWYDGRKDVVASTDAAIQLLKKLYARFDNDWLLAVAAYNAGDGNIQQAIDKNRRAGKPIDFWSLPLNKTTQGYIPQLMALSKIVADPNIYDFKLYPIADTPYFVKINVDSHINLADAAQQSALDVGLFKRLNAGFKNGLTDPNQSHDLLVPVDAAATFRLQLDSLPKRAIVAQYSTETSIKENTKSNYYTVKSGDSLWSIAKAQSISVDALARLNNLNSKSALQLGQKLMVSSQATSNETAVETDVKESKKLSYTIKAGDTLGQIAAKYDVSVKQIMQWNKIKDETSIRPNQELIVLVDAKN